MNAKQIKAAVFGWKFKTLSGFEAWAKSNEWIDVPVEIGYVNTKNLFGQFRLKNEALEGYFNRNFTDVQQDLLEGDAIVHMMGHPQYKNLRLVTDGKSLLVAELNLPDLPPEEAMLMLSYSVKCVMSDLAVIDGRILGDWISMEYGFRD